MYNNHTIISCFAFKCVCYWVETTEAPTRSRNMMKWDTKALWAILTSGLVIDIPAPDLTVISTQQRRGEGGREEGKTEGRTKRETNRRWEWQIIMTIPPYCMLLKCFHVTGRSVWSHLVQVPLEGFQLLEIGFLCIWQDTAESEMYGYNSHSYTIWTTAIEFHCSSLKLSNFHLFLDADNQWITAEQLFMYLQSTWYF